MKNIFILLITLIFLPAHAQKMSIEFGEIGSQESKMNSYENDPDAKAVVLYDRGESVFIDSERGYDISFTRHRRIKIFNKTASEMAEVSIPYYVDGYGKTEIVKSIEAITFNIQNGIVTSKKLDPSNIYEERISDRWFNKKFVFPDVQDGAILDLKYVIVTPFHFNLPDWSFQDKIPTIYSEYEVRMIPFYEYVFLAQGISKFDYYKSVIAPEKRTWGTVSKLYGQNMGNGIEFQDYVHTYVMKDIPAFNDESFITSINDYIIRIDFQLAKFHSPNGLTTEIISTWPSLNEALLKHDDFGKYKKSSSRLAKKILESELDLAGLSDNDRAVKIIEYVKANYEWNGSNSKYASQSAKDFINRKNGNVADVNLFMISLLEASGIDVEPVILSTRSHGKIPSDYPFDNFTNYVIALVNSDSPFFADGTESQLPYNRLPIRCLNEKGLIVNDDDQVQWLNMENNIPSLEKSILSLDIDTTTRVIQSKVMIQNTEYESLAVRKRYKDDTLKLKEYYSEKIGNINQIKTLNYEKLIYPYTLTFEGTSEIELLGSDIVLKPFLNLPLSKNPLTQKERNYPVDFIYPWNNSFESIIRIPDDYQISELPNSYSVDNDLAEIHLDYAISDGFLNVTGNYSFRKAVYNPKQYSRVKYYLDEIVKIFNELMILEKIN